MSHALGSVAGGDARPRRGQRHPAAASSSTSTRRRSPSATPRSGASSGCAAAPTCRSAMARLRARIGLPATLGETRPRRARPRPRRGRAPPPTIPTAPTRASPTPDDYLAMLQGRALSRVTDQGRDERRDSTGGAAAIDWTKDRNGRIAEREEHEYCARSTSRPVRPCGALLARPRHGAARASRRPPDLPRPGTGRRDPHRRRRSTR